VGDEGPGFFRRARGQFEVINTFSKDYKESIFILGGIIGGAGLALYSLGKWMEKGQSVKEQAEADRSWNQALWGESSQTKT